MDYRTLSISGGGVRTLASMTFLCDLAEWFQCTYRAPLESYFNGFAGTSAGSFVALPLARGDTLDYIKHVVYDVGLMRQSIEDRTKWRPLTLPFWNASLYKGEAKRKSLSDWIDESATLACVPMHKRLWVSAYNVDTRMPVLFDSHDIAVRDSVLALDIIDASTAAPAYYPSVIIRGEHYVDGGIGAHSPDNAVCFYSKQLMSIGTGRQCPTLFDPSSVRSGMWGVYKADVVDMLTRAPYQMCHQVMAATWGPSRFMRINGTLHHVADSTYPHDYKVSVEPDLATDANLAMCVHMGHHWFRKQSVADLKQFFDYGMTSAND